MFLLVGWIGLTTASATRRNTPTAAIHDQETNINKGKTTGRQWAILLATNGSYMAASGQDLMAADTLDG